MHYLLLVVTDDTSSIEDELEPYSQHNEVAPYRGDEITEEEWSEFLQHYTLEAEEQGVDVTDRKSMYRTFGDSWSNSSWKYIAGEGKWFQYYTRNPEGHFDYYYNGWDKDTLQLREGAEFELGDREFFNEPEPFPYAAKKADITNLDDLAKQCCALLHYGIWIGMVPGVYTSSKEEAGKLSATVRDILADEPDDAMIAIINCHT